MSQDPSLAPIQKGQLIRRGLVILAVTMLLAVLLYDIQPLWSYALGTVGILTLLGYLIWSSSPVRNSHWRKERQRRSKSEKDNAIKSPRNTIEKSFNQIARTALGVFLVWLILRFLFQLDWAVLPENSQTIAFVALSILGLVALGAVLDFLSKRPFAKTIFYSVALVFTAVPLLFSIPIPFPQFLLLRIGTTEFTVQSSLWVQLVSGIILLISVSLVVSIESRTDSIKLFLTHNVAIAQKSLWTRAPTAVARLVGTRGLRRTCSDFCGIAL